MLLLAATVVRVSDRYHVYAHTKDSSMAATEHLTMRLGVVA
jgi:hypothetical protein